MKKHIFVLLSVILTLAPLSTFAQSRTLEAGGYKAEVAPAPAWVQLEKLEHAAIKLHKNNGPLRAVLFDNQFHLADQTRYNRVVLAIADSAALDESSQIKIAFHPEYESLRIHAISIVRNGVTLDKLADARVDFVRRETQLERQTYDGLVTAIMIMKDIRVNDVVDYSYSVQGDNPVFGNKFGEGIGLAFDIPVDKIRARFIYPAERNLFFRAHNSNVTPRIETSAGSKQIVVAADNTPAVPFEEGARSGLDGVPWLQVSEYRDWNEVAQWAHQLFEVSGELDPDLLTMIESLRKQGGTSEELIRRALRMVQEEVRYFGIEIGQNSHRPTHPNATLKSRIGDCKDKTLLLVTLLRKLGFQAAPALVSYGNNALVADWLPSPQAFDHVITKVDVGAKTYWLDATRTSQGGRLQNLGTWTFGKALLVARDTGGLIDVTRAAEPSKILVEEMLAAKQFDQPAKLRITTTATNERAEFMRLMLAEKGQEVISQSFSQQLVKRYPDAKPLGQLEVRDDVENNRIELQELYEVPNFWTYQRGSVTGRFDATAIAENMFSPTSISRRTPVKLEHPVEVSHEFVIELPQPIPFRLSPPAIIGSPQFEYEQVDQLLTKQLRVRCRIRTLSAAIEPGQVSAYADKAQKVRATLSRRYSLPVITEEQAKSSIEAELRGAKRRGLFGPPEAVENLLASFHRNRAIASAAIASGQLSGKHLASAHVEHAVASNLLSEPDKAAQYLDRALQLDPQSVDALESRAELFNYLGKFEDALREFTKIAELDQNRNVYHAKGQSLYYSGHYDEAAEAFRNSLRQSNAERYDHSLIWLAMTTARAGKNVQEALEPFLPNSNKDAWPGQALPLFLGQAKPEEILKLAGSDRKQAPLRLCEGYFFVGEYELSRRNAPRAKDAFARAVDTGATMYREYAFAKIQLDRIPR